MFICLMIQAKYIFLLAWCLLGTSVFGQVSTQKKEALLILPGFGSKIFGTRILKRYFNQSEMPVYIPKYISRKSIEASELNLEQYYMKQELYQYDELHVMSYIVGSWTLNQWIKDNGKRNIKTIVYDRSPLQERAPNILLSDLRLVNAIVFGEITKDFVNTPYPVLMDSSISLGMFIETYATNLVRKHQSKAMEQGPLRWDLASLKQPVDDYMYLPLNHDQLYTVPEYFGSEVFYFIKHGEFSSEMKKNQPVENPFIKRKKK
jgi:hypothetical protein